VGFLAHEFGYHEKTKHDEIIEDPFSCPRHDHPQEWECIDGILMQAVLAVNGKTLPLSSRGGAQAAVAIL
jgi:hypothetical protein